MAELIDDILASLISARKTMENQTSIIGEIMDTSTTLLDLDTQNDGGHTTTMSSTSNVYNLSTDSEMALVNIFNQFHELMQDTNNETAGYSAIDGYRQRAEYLGSSVRKLKSVCDTVSKMKICLQEQQDNEIENAQTGDED